MIDDGKSSHLKLLISGTVFFISGIFFLLRIVYKADYLNIVIPVLLMMTGIFFLYLNAFHKKNSRYFILGIFWGLLGIFFISNDIIFSGKDISDIWPLFMFIFGVILILYSLTGRKTKKISILVPSAALCLLSLIFMPFSFKLITMSFLRFVSVWWPVLFIASGCALITIYFVLFYSSSGRKGK